MSAETRAMPRRRRGALAATPVELSTGRFGLIVVAVVAAHRARRRCFWTPFDPQQVDDRRTAGRRRAGRTCSAPTAPGRDILSLLMAGARTTVFVAVGAGRRSPRSSASLSPRSARSPPAGCARSVAVLVDILIAFPVLIIAMMISAVWGGSLVGRHLGGRHRLRREHRPRHPAGAAPRAAQRLRARRPRLRAHPGAEPRAPPAAQRRAGLHRAALVGDGRRGARRGGPVVPRLRRPGHRARRGGCCWRDLQQLHRRLSAVGASGRGSRSRSRCSASTCSATRCARRPTRRCRAATRCTARGAIRTCRRWSHEPRRSRTSPSTSAGAASSTASPSPCRTAPASA